MSPLGFKTRVGSSGGSKGAPSADPPTDQNYLNFLQFFGKIWQICMLAAPPRQPYLHLAEAYVLHIHLSFNCGATPADLLAANMAALKVI